MSLDDWILVLHVLSAFCFIGALVLFWVLVFTLRRTDLPGPTARLRPLMNVGDPTVTVGVLGTIVFGVWLSLSLPGLDLWDGWIIAAIVLWAVSAEAGRRAGAEYRTAIDKAAELEQAGATGPSTELAMLNRTGRGLLLHTVSSVAALLVLVDMIWKPGA